MRIDVRQEIYCSKSSKLINKRIFVLGTGSVALYKTPDVIRELIRHGADVEVMLSPTAASLISPSVFQWATGRKVHLEITGDVEHVLYAGEHSEKVDLIIVCPMTASTLGKVVNGVADTNISLTLMTAIGSNIPIIFVPGMHEPMFNNQFVQENINKIKKQTFVQFLEPRIEDNKAKIPSLNTIVSWTIKTLSLKPLQGKKILITGGPTAEYIDRVRYITNPSSGKMGYALAKQAWFLGAEVTFIVGPNNLSHTEIFNSIQVQSANEMADAVKSELLNNKYDIGIFSSAVADYMPESIIDQKISSGQSNLSINLKPTIKILNMVRDLVIKDKIPNLITIGFKAEYKKPIEELVKICNSFLTDKRANIMIANLIDSHKTGFSVDSSEVFIVELDRKKPIVIKDTKIRIAEEIFMHLLASGIV